MQQSSNWNNQMTIAALEI